MFFGKSTVFNNRHILLIAAVFATQAVVPAQASASGKSSESQRFTVRVRQSVLIESPVVRVASAEDRGIPETADSQQLTSAPPPAVETTFNLSSTGTAGFLMQFEAHAYVDDDGRRLRNAVPVDVVVQSGTSFEGTTRASTFAAGDSELTLSILPHSSAEGGKPITIEIVVTVASQE